MAESGQRYISKLWVKVLGLTLLCLGFLSGTGCKQLTPQNELEIIKEKGELRVLIRNNATCYYEGPEGLLGFEYDLVKGFADHLGVKLTCVVTHNFQDMIPSLLRGEADLIAAGFTVTEKRQQKVTFGPPYMEVQQQVMGRRGGPSPENVAELVGQPLWINAGTSYEERLRELKQQFPHLSWLPVSDYETEELLEMVWRGIIPLTIADSNIVAVNRRYYPQLKIHFAIEDQVAEGDLVVTRWLNTAKHTGELMGIPATDIETTSAGMTLSRIAEGPKRQRPGNRPGTPSPWDAVFYGYIYLA